LLPRFRELREAFRLVEQRHAKPIRGLHVFFCNVPNDAFEVVQCQRLVSYFEVH
jgi:hypothetical protein